MPSSKRSVPAPTGPPTGCIAVEVVFWALASPCTSTLNVVATVPPTAEAVMAEVFDDVTPTAFQPVTLVSLPTASDSVETSDLI